MTSEIPPSVEEEFPMFLYIHDHEGFHDGKIKIPDQACLSRVFPEMIAPAIRAGKEVIVTDVMDCCTFHAREGKIIFPSPEPAQAILAQ